MAKHNAKWFLAILVLGIYPLVLQATDVHGEMKVLADSALKMKGKNELPAINAHWMKLAKKLNDTLQIASAYDNLTSHYYQLGDIDSLKKYTYEYMAWCVEYNRSKERYVTWRQYIQRMTEKGMQEESMAETAKLHDDAKHTKDKYGLACGEMCIGYNHRVFGNNVQLCIESYNNALKLFEEGGYFRDAYVVLLNIIQTYLSRSEYVDAESYLNKLVQLEDKMNRKKNAIDPSLHLRFCEFRVISLLANQGKRVA
ncbi:MAG: sensor histidine kinase, partial [Muribaculaceae bacterium]